MSRTQLDRWRVAPGTAADIASRDPASTEGAPGDKKETRAVIDDLNDELADLQERLWAEGERSLLVVLQALDAGGKDGTIKKVFSGVNPQGCRVATFRVPTEQEKAHDFLWRVNAKTPADGEIVIFNRSHYEDVLVVRVHDLVPRSMWSARYEMINDFERLLGESGTRVVKLFLHISKDEQASRFRKRLEKPEKRWKFRRGDLDERKHWDDYVCAYEDALTKTSTDEAPWYVVPADRKWYRDWVVATILVETLRYMDPQFPAPEEDLEGVVVE